MNSLMKPFMYSKRRKDELNPQDTRNPSERAIHAVGVRKTRPKQQEMQIPRPPAAPMTSDPVDDLTSTVAQFPKYKLKVTKPLWDKINQTNALDTAFQMVMGQTGSSELLALRRQFQPDEWDTVAASVMNKMGRTSTPEFSNADFMENYKALSPQAKMILFGNKRFRETIRSLDGFIPIVDQLRSGLDV